MVKRVIVFPGAVRSSSPISAAVVTGNLVFVSGQTSTEAADIAGQTRSVLDKLGLILRAAGTDLSHVVSTRVYLREAKDFQEMNGVFKEFFPHDPPSRSTIVTVLVRPEMLVEIECVAELG